MATACGTTSKNLQNFCTKDGVHFQVKSTTNTTTTTTTTTDDLASQGIKRQHSGNDIYRDQLVRPHVVHRNISMAATHLEESAPKRTNEKRSRITKRTKRALEAATTFRLFHDEQNSLFNDDDNVDDDDDQCDQ